MSWNVYMSLFVKRGYASQEDLERLIDIRMGLRQFEEPDCSSTSQVIWGVWPNRDEKGWDYVKSKLPQLREWCREHHVHGVFVMEDEHGWDRYKESM
jgi:hypothetical protein